MNARVTAAERAALPVARAALESQGSAYGMADTIVFALGGAQLLQCPESAAELAALRTRLADAELPSSGRPSAEEYRLEQYAQPPRVYESAAEKALFEIAIGLRQVLHDTRLRRDDARAGREDAEAELTRLRELLHEVQGIARRRTAEAKGRQAYGVRLAARVTALETERHSTNEALSEVAEAIRAKDVGDLTVYQASHDSIVIGHYRTAQVAREHCTAYAKREHHGDGEQQLWWREDEDTVDLPDEGVAELIERIGSGPVTPTGYLVTPVSIAAAFDADGDE